MRVTAAAGQNRLDTLEAGGWKVVVVGATATYWWFDATCSE